MITTYHLKKTKKRRSPKHKQKAAFFAFIIAAAAVTATSFVLQRPTYGKPVTVNIEPIEAQDVSVAAVEIEAAADEAQAAKTESVQAAAGQTSPREMVFTPLPVSMPESDQRIVFDICKENNIAFTFVMALIGHETDFTKDARSITGDSGYMQINDCNLEALAEKGFTDMNDTAQNVGAGVSILRELFDAYGDDEVHKVLMCYNMGESRARELWAQGVTTSEYSRAIVDLEREYSAYIDAQLIGE